MQKENKITDINQTDTNNLHCEERLKNILEAIKKLSRDNFDINISDENNDIIGNISKTINELKDKYNKLSYEFELFSKINKSINAGITLDQILNLIYDQFKKYIPYDRIGLALLEDNGNTVRARWSRSEFSETQITVGYTAKMEGSSLRQIIDSGEPRIINDLEEYLKEHPESQSTQKIVSEGVMSSFTCPLVALDKPIGFLFFSSKKKNTYKDVHIEIFNQIAQQVSIIVEKARLYEELKELNQLKNKFVGIVAHDLRSPISIVKGFGEIFLKGIFGELTETQRQYIQKISKVCDTMMFLIDDLLDVSAIESGNLKLELSECDFEKTFCEWHEYNSVLAKSKSMELILELDKDMPKVTMDINRISQVVNNLVSNAIKYSFPESKIYMRARIVGENIEVSIKDEGQGIPENEIPVIFSQFGRGSVRPTGGEKSIGLGLAIVKHIIKAHEGQIWVDSKVSEGSTFTFSIPIKGPSKINSERF